MSSKDLIFAADVSAGFLTLALIQDQKILAKSQCVLERSGASGWLEAIDHLFDSAQIQANQVTKILFCSGPGRFTALRVGLSVLLGIFGTSENSCEWLTASSLTWRALSLLNQNPESSKAVVVMKQGSLKLSFASLDRLGVYEEKTFPSSDLAQIISAANESNCALGGDAVQHHECGTAEGFLELILNQKFLKMNQISDFKLHYLPNS